MNLRLDRLEKIPGSVDILKKIQEDPIEGGLFREFVDSIPEADGRTQLQEILTKRIGREDGLTPAENTALHNRLYKYIERKKYAELILANLNKDEDVKQLGVILKQHTGIVDPHQFELFIMGLAVRNAKDLNAFGTRVAEWKRAARDKVAERKTAKWENKLYKIGERMGVSQAEIDRFMQIDDESVRMHELKNAIGRSGVGKALWDIARSPVILGDGRARGLNEMINEVRKQANGVRAGLNDTVAILASIDTSTDKWWKGIPDVEELLKKRNAESVPQEEKPVSMSEAREMTSEKEIIKQVEAEFAKIPNGKERFEQAKQAHPGDPAAFWNETIDVNGTPKKFDDIFKGVTSKMESSVKSRGMLSELIRILFEPLMRNNFNKAKNRLEATA